MPCALLAHIRRRLVSPTRVYSKVVSVNILVGELEGNVRVFGIHRNPRTRVRVAPVRFALVRFALVRSALWRFALVRSAPVRSALWRFA